MAKWGYLARAYAIAEYAYYRSIQPEEEDQTELDTLPNVIEDIKDILEMAEDNFESVKETPYEYRTIKQCEKFLADFDK